ncbi:hypothetical protein DESC_940002 [Desulfosarcina cetonica]|nr:hypothetical protein DESC_940002 [Desulfosarcina cetonica]
MNLPCQFTGRGNYQSACFSIGLSNQTVQQGQEFLKVKKRNAKR